VGRGSPYGRVDARAEKRSTLWRSSARRRLRWSPAMVKGSCSFGRSVGFHFAARRAGVAVASRGRRGEQQQRWELCASRRIKNWRRRGGGGNPYRRWGRRGTREGASPSPSEGRGPTGGIEASGAWQADVTRVWHTEGGETNEWDPGGTGSGMPLGWPFWAGPGSTISLLIWFFKYFLNWFALIRSKGYFPYTKISK
jgi:hypothetical protein